MLKTQNSWNFSDSLYRTRVWFNNAILCLYGDKPRLAIQYVDQLLKTRTFYEALFIKTKALTLLGDYQKADELNVLMGDMLSHENGGDGYDMKFILSVATVNERIGDPCLGAYQRIVTECPKYMPIHKALFEAMKKKRKEMLLAEGHELPKLAKVFNETEDVNLMMEYLKKAIDDNPSELNDYIETINKQVF